MTTLADRIAEGRRIKAEARAELELKFGMSRFPEKARDMIWRKAWEDGHSSGLDQVRFIYDELADIAFASAGVERIENEA